MVFQCVRGLGYSEARIDYIYSGYSEARVDYLYSGRLAHQRVQGEHRERASMQQRSCKDLLRGRGGESGDQWEEAAGKRASQTVTTDKVYALLRSSGWTRHG